MLLHAKYGFLKAVLQRELESKISDTKEEITQMTKSIIDESASSKLIIGNQIISYSLLFITVLSFYSILSILIYLFYLIWFSCLEVPASNNVCKIEA